MWSHQVRQTAGAAAVPSYRGPVETQLERNRRHIPEDPEAHEELEAVRRVLGTAPPPVEERRPMIALVGYTNAGKSTL
jgi:50S ribosomal subunit-associated GTPase HflX